MSYSVQPHRRQPTRPHRPWESPGKNTGVGCHFLLQCMKVKSESEVAQSCPTLSDPMDCSLTGSSIHGIFQARVLEWVAIAFSRSSLPRDWTWVSSIVLAPALPCDPVDWSNYVCNKYTILYVHCFAYSYHISIIITVESFLRRCLNAFEVMSLQTEGPLSGICRSP